MEMRETDRPGDEGLARALGWFSIGLGVAELVAPRGIARMIGVRDHRILLRAVGLREMASGVGILTQRRPAGWLWARVVGDVMDLALVGAAFRSPRARRGRLALATAAVAGVTALDVVASRRLSRRPGEPEDDAIRITKSITINRSPEEIYRFWRDFRNLPRFMRHLESVQVTSDKRSHWMARGPAGKRVEWDAEIVDDKPNELIAWRSLEGSDVETPGSVRFQRAPGGRGTVVKVELLYRPPGGLLGSLVAKLFGADPDQQVAEDLRRLKQVMETGEIATSAGPSARRSRRLAAAS